MFPTNLTEVVPWNVSLKMSISYSISITVGVIHHEGPGRRMLKFGSTGINKLLTEMNPSVM